MLVLVLAPLLVLVLVVALALVPALKALVLALVRRWVPERAPS